MWDDREENFERSLDWKKGLRWLIVFVLLAAVSGCMMYFGAEAPFCGSYEYLNLGVPVEALPVQ